MKDLTEKQMVDALEPMIEQIVAVERDVDAKWAATQKLLVDEREFAADQLTKAKAAIDAVDGKVAETEIKAFAAIDALRAGDIEELRIKNLEAVAFVQRSFDDLVTRIDEAVKASNEAVDTAGTAARDAVGPVVEELRNDFAEAITGVKRLLDQQLSTITSAAREFDERLKLNEQRAADHLVMAASVFGA